MYEVIAIKTLCDEEGCMTPTSDKEKQALQDFYTATNGPFWINNDNWLTGDP